MKPPTDASPAGCGPRVPRRRSRAPLWVALAIAVAWTSPPALADEERPPARGGEQDDQQVFDFTGLDIGGRLRTPQLLYFLDRAREELMQASLERRSFLPEMVRSIDEESL